MRTYIIIPLLLLSSSVFAQNRIPFDSLKIILEQVFDQDQKSRYVLDSLQKKHGYASLEVNSYWEHVNKQDSLNKKIVTSTIDTYGWLSIDETSLKASSSLFLVIQHADIETQSKYLPVPEKAIKTGKADKEYYA